MAGRSPQDALLVGEEGEHLGVEVVAQEGGGHAGGSRMISSVAAWSRPSRKPQSGPAPTKEV